MIQTNYLIIGSGVAGLTFAIKIADRFPHKNITIVTKASEEESNTKYAQGGVAVVVDKIEDSCSQHIKDTLLAGDGLSDEAVVSMVINQGPQRLKELIKWGAEFDKDASGNYDLGKEGGHSQNRVVHHKDQTGLEIERAIISQVHQKKNIQVLEHHFALDLITDNNCCLGAYVLNQKTNEILVFKSDVTLIATGGIGHLYGHTTNPVIATGDGIAMAARAGAQVTEMEFIQFHPTALYEASSRPTFLISEAVRGAGAYLRTKKGERFMTKYDDRAELASRDIVSQSIDMELKKTGDPCVYLDCRHLDRAMLLEHFPMIYQRCKSIGIDMARDLIPVVPAQHYLCGGISVNTDGKTSVENLFACGECSRTGLHGANRLASNSLLEALVYSDKIYHYLESHSWENADWRDDVPVYDLIKRPKISAQYTKKLKKELQHLMRQNAGIIRYNSDLLNAEKQLHKWQEEVQTKCKTHQISCDLYELKNMIVIALLIVRQSILRDENHGGFVKFTIGKK